MADKQGTPLVDVVGFPVDLIDRLAELWITTADEFFSAAVDDGATGLAEYLGISEENVDALIDLIRPLVAVQARGEIAMPGLGALDDEPSLDPSEALLAATARAPLPSVVDLIERMPPVRDQKERGTCVAYACSAVREFLMGAHASPEADLSEQYLYWACKQRDKWPGEGTWIKVGMQVLQDQGICPEPVWPYNPKKIPGNEGQGPPPEGAHDAATPFRITSGELLQARWVSSMKEALADGKAVAFAVPVYRYWLTDPVRTTGDIRMPLSSEQDIGGHAMAIVGYEDDPSVPGGGYFMVRNSWGETWAANCALGAGYARLPYEFISRFGRSAYTASAPDPSKPEPPGPEPKPEPPKPKPGSNWLFDLIRRLFPPSSK